MITTKSFGATSSGEAVTMFTITREDGSYVELLNYGCIVRALCVQGRDGKLVDVTLGYDDVAGYERNSGNYFGAAVGRHANRIGGASFTLGGKQYTLAANNGVNHLHGGIKGFDRYIWEHCLTGDNSIEFRHTSPDGDEGYPAKLEVTITYTFDKGGLDIAYNAVSDGDTVVNLTNHSYFNLGGKGTIESHLLTINADSFTPNDSGCLPTGEIRPVAGTPFDFTAPRAIGDGLASDYEQVAMFGGFDHNFCLRGSGYRHVATLASPDSGIVMDTHTTKPGVQVYCACALSNHTGKGGAAYGKYSAVCLETQYYPNAMRCDNFPSIVLHAGERYSHRTTYSFSVK